MRIAHVSSYLSNQADGVRAAIEQLSAAQQARGNDITVHALADRHDRAEGGWQGAPLRLTPCAGPRSFGFSPKMAARLRVERPRIVHAHGLWMYPPCAAMRVCREIGAPFVLSTHGMLNPYALSLSRLKKRAASLLYQDRVFAAASLIHATSPHELEEVRAYGLTQPVAVIPNGVNWPDNRAPGPRSRTVLALGRIHPIKGLDRLIAAWAQVEADFPDWSLLIVGPDNGGHARALTDQARSLGIGRLRIEGPSFGAARDAALADAGLFVLPSLSENFAMTVAESLAAGTPAIVSTAAPWPGIAEQGCGWWIDPTPDRLAEALREAMALPDAARSAMGQRGRRLVREHFTWAAIAGEFAALFDWMLGTSDRRPSFVAT